MSQEKVDGVCEWSGSDRTRPDVRKVCRWRSAARYGPSQPLPLAQGSTISALCMTTWYVEHQSSHLRLARRELRLKMDDPPLASLSLTHVHYNPNDPVSHISAYLALVPQALVITYVALIWSTREIEILLMFAGQMGCEGLNWILKRYIKEERPSRKPDLPTPRVRHLKACNDGSWANV